MCLSIEKKAHTNWCAESRLKKLREKANCRIPPTVCHFSYEPLLTFNHRQRLVLRCLHNLAFARSLVVDAAEMQDAVDNHSS